MKRNGEKTCCFIGHRSFPDTPEVRERLRGVLTELIENGTVNFLFGDHSAFVDLCYKTVTELKENAPEIRRIHFRCVHENANDYTMHYLLIGYEDSVCPKGVGNAGRARYVLRDQAMIRESDVCVFYYDEGFAPPERRYSKRHLTVYQPKSGTALAYRYAIQKRKRVVNLCR